MGTNSRRRGNSNKAINLIKITFNLYKVNHAHHVKSNYYIKVTQKCLIITEITETFDHAPLPVEIDSIFLKFHRHCCIAVFKCFSRICLTTKISCRIIWNERPCGIHSHNTLGFHLQQAPFCLYHWPASHHSS